VYIISHDLLINVTLLKIRPNKVCRVRDLSQCHLLPIIKHNVRVTDNGLKVISPTLFVLTTVRGNYIVWPCF